MTNLLTRKLELFGRLSDEDRAFLDGLIRTRVEYEAGQDIIAEGDSPRDVHLVLEGIACRYKVLEDGSRQIMAYLLPGDLCDPHVFVLNAMDHSISALSRSTIVDIPRREILDMFERTGIARALWWATLVDEATLREWLVNIGQRGAKDRLAHLFCEIHARLDSIGLTDNGRFALPITQADLASTIGVSVVHVNRALQELRRDGLITFRQKEVEILDVDRLRAMSAFNINYLHLTGGKRDDGNA